VRITYRYMQHHGHLLSLFFRFASHNSGASHNSLELVTILPDLMGHDFKSQVPGLVGNQGVSSSVGSQTNVFMSHDLQLQAGFDSTDLGGDKG